MDPVKIKKSIRILTLEDEPTDAERAERELRNAGIVFTSKRVSTREAFIQALEDFRPDIILADYTLPSFDGMAALGIVEYEHPEVPVIIVTGTLSDIKAVELMRAGAKDYVLKDRLARLAPAVQYALAAEQESRAHKATEIALHDAREQLACIVESSSDAIFSQAFDGLITSWNHGAEVMLGFTAAEMIGQPVSSLFPPGFQDREMQAINLIKAGQPGISHRSVLVRKNGGPFAVLLTSSPILDANQQVSGVSTIARDIAQGLSVQDQPWEERCFS